MLDKPKVQSSKDIVEYYTDLINIRLKTRQDMEELISAVHKVTECWAGSSKSNKWSRRAFMYCFSASMGEIDIYLSPRDSMKSLFSYFEAIQGELPDLEFTQSDTHQDHVSHRATYKDCIYDFNVYIEKSDTCKMVPVYETKRVLVGTKVVCND